MSDSSIRPDRLHREYLKLQKRDLGRLFRKEGIRRRLCPVCGGGANRAVKADGISRYARCLRCGLTYLNPCPSPAALRAYFENSRSASYFHEKILLGTEKVRRKIFEARADLVASRKGAGGRLVDLGCSVGTFLKAAQKRGWKVRGVEPNAAARKIAQSRRLTVFEDLKALPGAPGSKVADVVTAWEVIAHVEDPVAFLKEVAGILRPKGMLILTTPNVEGIEYTALGGHHPNLAFPFLQIFSPGTVRRLCRKAGLDILSLETPGAMDFENIGNHLPPRLRKRLPDFLQELIFNPAPHWRELKKRLQQAVSRAGESGHLLLIARKL